MRGSSEKYVYTSDVWSQFASCTHSKTEQAERREALRVKFYNMISKNLANFVEPTKSSGWFMQITG